MKTCRFCMHEQESGEYCEACGSPFSADKLDFSDASMPDPTAGAFPDPTKNAFPEAKESAATPEISNGSVPEVMPVAAAGAPSMDAPKPENASSEEKADKIQPEKNEEFSDGSKKIMYSASQYHETVYLKGKGNLLKKGKTDPKEFSPYLTEREDAPTQQQGAGWWNGAAPSASSAPQSEPSTIPTPPGVNAYSASASGGNAAVPSWLYAFSIVMIVLGGLGTICLCGAGFIPLVMALIALSKITSVKNGSSDDTDHDLNSAKILLIISVVILVLCSILMITTVLL